MKTFESSVPKLPELEELRIGRAQDWKSFLISGLKLLIGIFDVLMAWLFQFRIFSAGTSRIWKCSSITSVEFSIEYFDECIILNFHFGIFRTENFRVWKGFITSAFGFSIESFDEIMVQLFQFRISRFRNFRNPEETPHQWFRAFDRNFWRNYYSSASLPNLLHRDLRTIDWSFRRTHCLAVLLPNPPCRNL